MKILQYAEQGFGGALCVRLADAPDGAEGLTQATPEQIEALKDGDWRLARDVPSVNETPQEAPHV